MQDLVATQIGGVTVSPKTCLDAGRTVLRLGVDLENNRQQALAPPAAAQDEATNTLILRNLQRWLSVAWFVAHDAREIHLVNDRNADPADPTFDITPPSFALADAIATSVDASALLTRWSPPALKAWKPTI